MDPRTTKIHELPPGEDGKRQGLVKIPPAEVGKVQRMNRAQRIKWLRSKGVPVQEATPEERRREKNKRKAQRRARRANR